MSAAERREQLLDVTKDLVAEHGFHAVSIEAVARAAGVSRPIVYGHFHDLPGLLESLRARIATGRAAVVAQLAVAVRSGFGPGRESPDPELTAATLSAFADEQVRLMLTDPERYPVERIVDHARWWLDRLAG
jgi:AcrR family transcriptional regulator